MNLLKLYFSFSGRTALKEYWLFCNLPFMLLLTASYLLNQNEIEISPTFYQVTNVLILWPAIALSVKRFHDINKSGWWVLLHIIPGLGSAILFIMNSCIPGTAEENRYDLKAKEI